MPKMKTTYHLELSLDESLALKQLLGSLTDPQFENFGIEGEDRRMLGDIYNILPDKDEE